MWREVGGKRHALADQRAWLGEKSRNAREHLFLFISKINAKFEEFVAPFNFFSRNNLADADLYLFKIID